VEEKKRRGRPRKYRTREALLKARRRWAQAWREANPERWKAIQRRADYKRRHRSRKPKSPKSSSILDFPSLELGNVRPAARKRVMLK
jgi:hypothetical protein